jgi:transposase InsO family protein
MVMSFDDSHLHTIGNLQSFLDGTLPISFRPLQRSERSVWIRSTLVRLKYLTLKRQDRGIVRRYISKIADLSDAQLDRHIAAYRDNQLICARYVRRRFPVRYTRTDAELLARVDNATGRLSGHLTAQFCQNQYATGDRQFERLRSISSATVYRLRGTERYREEALVRGRTRSVDRPIGERCKPEPGGIPGFLRVDTVHQGDLGKEKGVYHINMVDEVTQWEVIIAIEQIAETVLELVLEEAMLFFPFLLRNFHSDCGGEYINYTVAGLLEKLRIRQTKSRPRRSTDNGLVESKNAAIIRREMGHWHIPGVFAPRINAFYRAHLIPFVNFHRPCHFPEREEQKGGKVLIRYRRKDCQTPYQKLTSLPGWELYLRPGITAVTLEQQAQAKTPLQAAEEKNAAKEKLFGIILPRHRDML